MALQDDLKKAEAALADTKVKSYTYKGKKYSLTELRDELIPELKELVKAELAEESRAEAIIAGGKLAQAIAAHESAATAEHWANDSLIQAKAALAKAVGEWRDLNEVNQAK